MIAVANIRDPQVKADVIAGKEGVLYCGRPNHWQKLRGSHFANPFAVGKDGTREEVIERYRMWLWSQPQLLATLAAMLEERRDWTLVCWCAPEACHCAILKELAEGMIKDDQDAHRD